MTTLHYLAYGSNLHPVRLQRRVPSAEFKGIISIPGYSLHFHKLHQEDQSGKCNMFLTGNHEDRVFGAIYEMKASEKPLLDQCEGEGYRCDTLQITIDHIATECFVYIAENSHIDNSLRPYHWYHDIVLLGAEHHGLPEDYLDRIRCIEAHEDPNKIRQESNQKIVDEMREYTSNFK